MIFLVVEAVDPEDRNLRLHKLRQVAKRYRTASKIARDAANRPDTPTVKRDPYGKPVGGAEQLSVAQQKQHNARRWKAAKAASAYHDRASRISGIVRKFDPTSSPKTRAFWKKDRQGLSAIGASIRRAQRGAEAGHPIPRAPDYPSQIKKVKGVDPENRSMRLAPIRKAEIRAQRAFHKHGTALRNMAVDHPLRSHTQHMAALSKAAADRYQDARLRYDPDNGPGYRRPSIASHAKKSREIHRALVKTLRKSGKSVLETRSKQHAPATKRAYYQWHQATRRAKPMGFDATTGHSDQSKQRADQLARAWIPKTRNRGAAVATLNRPHGDLPHVRSVETKPTMRHLSIHDLDQAGKARRDLAQSLGARKRLGYTDSPSDKQQIARTKAGIALKLGDSRKKFRMHVLHNILKGKSSASDLP